MVRVIRAAWFLAAYLLLLLIFCGCSVVSTPQGSIYSIGKTDAEFCSIELEENTEKEVCSTVKTHGISGEFATILRAIWGFIW